jgi:membrane AbrB-like protein
VSAVVLVALVAGGAAGAALGRLLHLPLWPLTGALVGAGAVQLAVGDGAPFPAWVVFVAQVLVGSTVGARLGPTVLQEFRQVVVPGVVAVVATVVAGIGLGLAVWSIMPVGLVEAVFGMVPGGVGEMVAAVASIGGDSALVAGMHIIRLLVVVTVMGALVGWFRRHEGGEPAGGEGP